ncbi:ABC transporter permease [uncultured Bacteroides sp.]|uniref:ABC transporter permease n=1 Tax=uncultured Bacteroides sp. TaxID=162156 RepID=UPI002AAC3AA6|nr:ABC transporter permease [uncultured Bacteroides sp.]
MYKQYLSQTLHLLKENKLLSAISIIGTALAISMIMVIVIVYEVKTANYEPETHRDRMLTVKWGGAIDKKHPDWQSNSMISLKVVKECFYPLKSAEAVTGVMPFEQKLANIPGGTADIKCDVSYTDNSFWKVFEFSFLEGKPFNKEEFESGIKKIVVSESIARSLYGNIKVVGKTIRLSYVDYTICGVVKDVSTMAEAAHADIWVPYTVLKGSLSDDWNGDLLGDFRCFILAHNSSDFDAIHKEVDRNVAILNSGQKDQYLTLRGQPDTQFVQMTRQWANQNSKEKETIIKYTIVFVILLLIPAINLSGMTHSRMRKRMSEIGVRKAFGANRKELLGQILYENFVLTLLGGVIGLLLSFISVFFMKEWLLSNLIDGFLGRASSLSMKMLFQPSIFLYAFLFCFLLNMLSAGIPAWKASRTNIVNALNDK